VLKNTALTTAIGFQELTNTAYSIASFNFKDFEMFTVLALVYLTLVWSLSGLIRLLEAHLALPEAI
jgi:polar amino acid transport system permease protein